MESATRKTDEEHEIKKLAIAVITRAFKSLSESDPREVKESAMFLSDNHKDGLLAFWLHCMAPDSDPCESHRMVVCNEIGRAATIAASYASFAVSKESHIGAKQKTRRWLEVYQNAVHSDIAELTDILCRA